MIRLNYKFDFWKTTTLPGNSPVVPSPRPTWEVPASGSENVSHWRHGDHKVKIVGTLCHKVLPDALLGSGAPSTGSLGADLEHSNYNV